MQIKISPSLIPTYGSSFTFLPKHFNWRSEKLMPANTNTTLIQIYYERNLPLWRQAEEFWNIEYIFSLINCIVSLIQKKKLKTYESYDYFIPLTQHCSHSHLGVIHKLRHTLRGGGGRRIVTLCDKGGGILNFVTSQIVLRRYYTYKPD